HGPGRRLGGHLNRHLVLDLFARREIALSQHGCRRGRGPPSARLSGHFCPLHWRRPHFVRSDGRRLLSATYRPHRVLMTYRLAQMTMMPDRLSPPASARPPATPQPPPPPTPPP